MCLLRACLVSWDQRKTSFSKINWTPDEWWAHSTAPTVSADESQTTSGFHKWAPRAFCFIGWNNDHPEGPKAQTKSIISSNIRRFVGSCPDSKKMRTEICKLKKNYVILMQIELNAKSFDVLTKLWLYIHVHMYTKLNINGLIRYKNCKQNTYWTQNVLHPWQSEIHLIAAPTQEGWNEIQYNRKVKIQAWGRGNPRQGIKHFLQNFL
jgi:hypothetical protein